MAVLFSLAYIFSWKETQHKIVAGTWDFSYFLIKNFVRREEKKFHFKNSITFSYFFVFERTKNFCFT